MPVSAATVFFDGMSHFTITGGETNSLKVDAALGGGPYQKLIAVDEWWGQPVYMAGTTRITRKDVILAAANKDGGAHVDPALTNDYKELTKGLWAITTEAGVTPIPDSQFYFLRQVGFEILHSPDLQTIATGNVAK